MYWERIQSMVCNNDLTLKRASEKRRGTVKQWYNLVRCHSVGEEWLEFSNTPNISGLMQKTLRRGWFDKIQIIEIGIRTSSIYCVLFWAFQFALLIDSYTKKQIHYWNSVLFHSVLLRIFSFLLITINH